MEKSSLSKTIRVVFVFCAVTAITSSAQVFTVADFSGPNGFEPVAGLLQASDGNFYGTTEGGGNTGGGTVFNVTPGGTLTTLYNFCSQPNCTDGDLPQAGLIQASDGNFYGTTYTGGSGSCFGRPCGTIFKITAWGTLTTLYRFGGGDGEAPTAGLIQASDGNFYGTTYYGGSGGLPEGTVFKITPEGTLTTLHSFCSQPNCTDGAEPQAGLIQASDGNFYGTTYTGGGNGAGTVFKITPSGTLTTLYNFCSQPNCTDGDQPQAGLIQASDGNFYGTTPDGGSNGGYGTVFKITPSGTLTTLHSFDGFDGRQPLAELIQATDGNFYGTTYNAGSGGRSAGTVFKITPGGTLTTLYSFCSQPNCADGENPQAGLIQASDGNLYGTTYEGGSPGDGTVFGVSLNYGGRLVPVTPCRLLDTRKANGGGGPIQGGTFQTFTLPQLAQQKGCAGLSSAAAYSLNVTVVPQGPLGYLTVWPTGQNQPRVSTLDSVDGRVKANAAIVPGGTDGAVNVFASNTTDVVLDIDGYFAPASGLAYYPLPSCRVADTRNAPGPLGGPYLSGGVPRDFPVPQSNCFPSGLNAAAYSFNFTVIPHVPLGYLTVWPAGQMQPLVSTLNAPTGTVVANAAIVPAGTDGDIEVFASNDTDLVIDVNGYFAAPGPDGLSLYLTTPCRVLDTRQVGNGQPFAGELTVNVAGSVCAPSARALAYVLNATVVPSGPLGYLTLWPNGFPQPGISTLNAIDGVITSNMAIVLTTNGKIDAFASNPTQLILDISSYFAP